MDIYVENGYDSRQQYLESLSDEYDVPTYIVDMYTELLGPEEDFDGLITELETYGTFN